MKSSCWRAIIGGILFAAASTICLAQEAPQAPSLSIELDPTLVRSLEGLDATLIERLQKQAVTSESASKLLQSLGLKPTDPTAESRLKKKELVLRHQYQVENSGRNVLVYVHPDSRYSKKYETIVICDSNFGVLEWQEVGGHSLFELAGIKTGTDGQPVLTLTRWESQSRVDPNKERGHYDYSLKGDKIERVGDIRWEPLLPRRLNSLSPVILHRF